MPDLRLYLLSTLFIFIMNITPGPNNALGMAVGLAHGYRAAFPHCLSVGFGQVIMMTGVYFGLGGFFDAYPQVPGILRILGTVYIVWLAIKVAGFTPFRRTKEWNATHMGDITKPSEKVTPLTFWQGILFQFVNVKGWLAIVMTYTYYIAINPETALPLYLYTLFIFMVIGVASISFWALCGVFLRRFLSSEGVRITNYVLAALLIMSVVSLYF